MAVIIDQLDHDAVPTAPGGAAPVNGPVSGQAAATQAAMVINVRRAMVREAARRARLWAD